MNTQKEIRFDDETTGRSMIIRGASGHDQLFTHELEGTFNATDAFAWARDNLDIVLCELDVADTLKVMLNQDLDDRRMLDLLSCDVAKLARDTDLLYAESTHGMHTLLDAHHRLATIATACARAGVEKFKMKGYIIPLADRERFRCKHIAIIDGVEREISPDDLLTEISGIYSQPDGSVYRKSR